MRVFLGGLLSLLLIGCSDDPEPLDLLELTGAWHFEMPHFTGSGATCSAPSTAAVGSIYGEYPQRTGFQWSVDSLVLTCVLPGDDTVRGVLREESLSAGQRSWLLLDVLYDANGPTSTSGCLLPVPSHVLVGDSSITNFRQSDCAAEPVTFSDRLQVSRSVEFRFPDTTGAPVYTLSGTAILRRD